MARETHEAPVGLDGEAVAGITGEAGDEAAEDVRGNRTVAKGGEAFLCEIKSFLQVKTPGRQSDREIYCPILLATGSYISTRGQMGPREVGREREGSRDPMP